MADDSRTSDKPERSSVLALVSRSPLGFFALAMLVAEAILMVLVTKAEGADRTLLIKGMIGVLVGSTVAVVFLGIARPGFLMPQPERERQPEGERLRDSLSFDQVFAEVEQTIERLENNDYELARFYRAQGDLQRLLDGLYSGLLYTSGAVPTGWVEPAFYGNLIGWDEVKQSLRVCYFQGPYNDEIITRSFPLAGPKQGVVSQAVSSGKLQIYNIMDSELKERGESRLKALVSIPVYADVTPLRKSGSILAVNIDSIVAGIFPAAGSAEMRRMEGRARQVASSVDRVNRMRTSLAENLSNPKF